MDDNQQTDKSRKSVFEPSEEEKEIKYEVADPNDYHKIRRLKKIHWAEEKFREARIRENQEKRIKVSTVAQCAVEYLRQVEPLARRTESDLLERTVNIAGRELTLSELLDNNGYVKIKKRKQKSLTRARSLNSERRYVDCYMGLNQSLQVVRLCDRFLDKHLSFDLTKEKEPAEI